MTRTNFEAIKSSKPRRDDAAQEAFKARKGKRHKTQRGNDRWENIGATQEYAESRHVAAIEHFPLGVPRWDRV